MKTPKSGRARQPSIVPLDTRGIDVQWRISGSPPPNGTRIVKIDIPFVRFYLILDIVYDTITVTTFYVEF